ncbi:OmpL47-type beta-barrel domain-containing protein [Mesobacillus selenatarsenatis]|uniref:OmpL47-type beta-barrel domain-containing protein n=1 Tax=Mesobacillus selenatarsenatis TaxID=388741 RepID=UPI001ADF7BB3|nr:Ig-like domain repeat protein [Mesobacillus selenatarsenatis]
MFKRLFKFPSLVVVMLLIAQLVLPIGSAFANDASSMLPPTDLAYVNPSPEDVKLTWNAVYGATGYNVYQIKEGQLILLGTAKTNSYSLNDLPEGSYTYTISTLSGEFESGPSAPITLDVVYPSMEAPTNLSYKIQNGNDIVLDWTASKYAQEYSVFEVLENGEYKLLTTTTSNSYKVTNAEADTYTYAVTAANPFFGGSEPTDAISVELVHPIMTKPANPSFTISNGTDVTLKWSSVPFAKGYNVYQVIEGQKVLKEAVTTTNLKLVNQPEGDYKYIVHSFSDRFGESQEGSEISLTVSPVVMQPPIATVRVQNFNDIYISWDRVDYADSYKVYQIVDGEKVLKDTVTRNYINYQKQESGDYQFEIHAYSDRFGESEDSAKLTVTVETYELDAPQNGAVNVKNGNDLTLTWDSVVNASNYNVYQIIDGVKVLKDSITTTTKTFTNLPEGNYEYEIFAYNARIGESKEGLKISTVLEHPEVTPPNNVEYSVTNPTSFTLSWDKAEYANSYYVYQILDGEKVLKRSVSDTSISYSNLEAGKYKYEVYAYSTRFGESKVGSPVEVTLDGYVMQAPGNLTYSISNGNDIKLQWDAVDYAASYKVYQVVDGEKILKSSPRSTYVYLSNQPEGELEFVVYSYSYFSSQSPEGTAIKISVVHPEMVKPENVNAAILNGNDVSLTWDSVSYATGYNIYEQIDGEEVLAGSLSSSSSPRKILSNVSEGEHDYIIRSVSNRFGESIEGTEVNVTVDFPEMQKPENLTQTINNGNDIYLKWDAAEFAKSYNIYQVKNGERELLRTATSTSAVLSNMPEGDYKIQVTSFSDRFGESAEASTVEFTLVFPIMQAPEDAYYTINNGNDIILRWDKSEYAKTYNIYQVTDGGKEFLRTVSGTSVSFTNMSEGDYHYEVHSYSDRFGESPLSSSIELTMVWPEMQPAVLTGKVVNANNMNLSWPQVTWANGYQVYKVVGENRELLYKGKALKYDVYNLTEETHSFEVVAYSDRFGESPVSNTWTENIIYPEMQAPVANLKLTSETSATITWNFVTYANGYNIYELIDGEPVLIAEKVNNLSYQLKNLTYANHLYYVTSYSNSFGESDPSETVLAKLIIDEEAPVTTSDVSTDWTNETVTVTLSATDNETGVAATYYSVNGSDFVEGTTFTFEEEGVHQVSFYSIDKVSNKEEVQTTEVKIDMTKPQTASDMTEDWATADVEVKLSVADQLSGVANTFYSVDGKDFAEGTTFTVSGDGEHQVKFYSVDLAGNVEDAQSKIVKIDNEAPVTTSNIEDKWYQEGVTVELTATDETSGVAKTFYSVNGFEYIEASEFTLEEDGVYEVSFYSVDAAGNVEAAQSQKVKIDSKAPVTTSNVEDKWYQEAVTVEFTAIDETSGVAVTFYSVNGSEYTEGPEIVLEEDGIYEVSYYSVDNAGNVEEAINQTVKIDTQVPVTTDNVSDLWYTNDKEVVLSAEDNFSGVDRTYYSINGSEYTKGTSFMVSEEGLNEVVYYSIDAAGNKEEAKLITVKVDKTAPEVTADMNEEYVLGSEFTIAYTAFDQQSGVATEEVTVNGVVYKNGDVIKLDQPGVYKLNIKVTDNAGLVTTVEKEFVVYIPATIQVLPKVIKGNKGIFTVKADLPGEFARSTFDVSTVLLNGVAPRVDNKGLLKQAEKGHFKFEREDFNWKTGKVDLEFTAYLDNGYLVKGTAQVDAIDCVSFGFGNSHKHYTPLGFWLHSLFWN